MPTYVCYLPRDRFSPDQKRQIVDAITFRHSEATGAPSYFVQVVIEEVQADRYLGGEKTSDHIWVRGDIRTGRTEEQRTGLMTKMMKDISLITSVRQENIWIYLCNLDPTDMIEYGHVLPAPGQEKAWFESLRWEQQRQTLSFDPSRGRAAQTASNVGTNRKSAHKSKREDATFSRSEP